jgi:hypothetical protein
MYFGLTNSPATFQTMMDTIFASEVAQKWLTIYMDDMGIHTKREAGETEEQHVERHRKCVQKVLDRLVEHDLYLEPAKCTFEQPHMDYLGIVIKPGEIHMEDAKVEKVKNWKAPTTVREIRKFLGFTGYYRYFIKDYSSIARPLIQLTHKAVKWEWKETQERAFQRLRHLMISKPVLIQPDFEKPFFVHTDASSYGAGAVLMQERDNGNGKPRQHPIAYYSTTFTPTERNYDVYERELLAVVKALEHWKAYLKWTSEPFTIVTDHANLLYWKAARKLNRRTARWHAELQDYHFTIQHTPVLRPQRWPWLFEVLTRSRRTERLR